MTDPQETANAIYFLGRDRLGYGLGTDWPLVSVVVPSPFRNSANDASSIFQMVVFPTLLSTNLTALPGCLAASSADLRSIKALNFSNSGAGLPPFAVSINMSASTVAVEVRSG